MTPGEAREAQRQQALLAAIVPPGASGPALRETGARAERGLAAYRSNAQGLAERALGAAFPTVRAMLGDEAFALLARGFRRDAPPQRGDIGEWGDELPGWIAAETGLAEWPWLADGARLDWALHSCARAADAAVDKASLARLGVLDPAALRIEFMPGLAVLVSPFPIATIHAAHAGDAVADATVDAFAPVRAALAAGTGEAVCVARQGWRAVAQRLSPAEAVFMQTLLAGRTLAVALDAAGSALDFGAWLQRAVTAAWLRAVCPMPDRYTAAPITTP